ncbi:hypothetical protein [uncultured Polaribacter sp.]|uniref:hypothetical protein n=1 Tax=uncultured Polaribacter sp. TaxID=174711 RepID=UPI0030D803CE
MKNTIKLFLLMLFVAPQFLSAQSITNVKTLLIENQYGNARLMITPNTYVANT